jgi:hypothetical protein
MVNEVFWSWAIKFRKRDMKYVFGKLSTSTTLGDGWQPKI